MAKKTQLGYQEIEERLRYFHEHSVPADDVAYRLLYCFGKSEAEIRRWREGKGTLKTFDGVLIKGLIAYQTATALQLGNKLESLKRDPQVIKAAPKIVAVSDGRTLLAYDLREHETYENPLQSLCYDFTFFYPLMNVERVRTIEENPADVKAAEKLAKLHDEIRAFNEFTSDSDLHDLNIFITRLLFGFFAEDTGIFEENLFTHSIRKYTLDDGSDLAHYLGEAFDIMDKPEDSRAKDTNTIVGHFPYVNGGLFRHHIQIPSLSARARRIILECGELNWQDINPDIFGSMIQAVVNPDVRANQGMHYTSVPNIMKVINPLFLDELRAVYDAIAADAKALKQNQNLGMMNAKQYEKEYKEIEKRCNKLLLRMKKMKFFDPACGSGNFLIITYKALRLLEMDILGIMRDYDPKGGTFQFIDGSVINVNQFYGIELLDFPHEVAMLSLWLAEHQMNKKLNEGFGINTRALPLHNITQIVCGNACRLDWNVVCPHEKEDEVFVFGNPPYLGSRNQTIEQKKDMDVAFNGVTHGMLDYIGCWFVKGTYYTKHTKATYAFVSTNSIIQGAQIPLLWPLLFNQGQEIQFAYKEFPWSNNAKNNAGVTCVIIGMGGCNKEMKTIYDGNNKKSVVSINPSLSEKTDVIISPVSKSICGLKPILKGSLPADDNNLTLYEDDKNSIIQGFPNARKFIKRFIGAGELINKEQRFCIWVTDKEKDEAYCIPEFAARFSNVAEMRKNSKKTVTQNLSTVPYKFAENRFDKRPALVIPVVSSERRNYLPIDFTEEDTVVYYSAFAIYDADCFDFGLVESHLHMLWVKNTAGRLEMRIRYSAQLCYNTFPFPKISESKKSEIESAAEEVLIARENHPGSTLADLYDPDKMPQDLLDAHHRLDDIVESCYPGYPFANDEARLECLFKLYEKMTKK